MLGGPETLHLSDTFYMYVVPSGELSGEIEYVLERCCKASA